MKIYNYDEMTGEFLFESEAELDPAEWQINHKKVYLMPANATKTKPPKTSATQIAIFQNDSWEIEDNYKGMYMVDENMSPVFVDFIGSLPEGFVPCTEAQANKILEDKIYYVIQNGELIINPNYDEDKEKEKEEIFNANFFPTSLGYIRRTVKMQNLEELKFLSDILPLLEVGTPVLVYSKDLKQSTAIVTEQFIAECKAQLYKDFYGDFPNEPNI
ncbi:MAG: hypothetical protein J6Q32_05925 [Clostridia bacterium]|nr:hypothetical protein [Clostridia bacterium]